MADPIRDLIFQVIDQTISPEDFDRLQDAIEHHEEVRQAYLETVGMCESLGEIAVESVNDKASAPVTVPLLTTDQSVAYQTVWRFSASQLAVAATLLLLVGGGAFWFGQWNQAAGPERVAKSGRPAGDRAESRIAGHATLRRAVDIEWLHESDRRHEGDVLPNGLFTFDGGVAEIDFFCGATLIVEGPALLDIESDWSVRVAEGRLRANVPPSARGFVVRAADAEIIDLGTEFALEVSREIARVEVIDGEVKLRGGEHGGKHLITGQAASLRGTPLATAVFDDLSTVSDLSQQRQEADERRFESWKTHSQRLRADQRLIAYFPIAEGLSRRIVPNVTTHGRRFDGLTVGPVNEATGRFGPESTGLEFDRPGSRVRTRIDGDYEAFTFVCWTKIDSLEHRYNALFMADSYENGEPHWQIRDDGCLMFSVMVDDSQLVRHFSEIDQQMVTQAGLHRVYYTEPFWDRSKSGRWFQLAAVYDPAGR
ncbi:MAG: FecR domain-containing protein, partial [Planctomycetota bacterium]